MKISRREILTGGGVPCSLAAAIKVGVGQQASFAHYGKLAARTANAGECDLCGAAAVPLGVFTDVSPKGDSGTVETTGFVDVKIADSSTVAVGGFVTPAAGGLVAKIAGAAPTLAELTAGVWQVDSIVDATTIQIQIDARL